MLRKQSVKISWAGILYFLKLQKIVECFRSGEISDLMQYSKVSLKVCDKSSTQRQGQVCGGVPRSWGGGPAGADVTLQGPAPPRWALFCNITALPFNTPRCCLSVRITLLLTLRENTWQIDTILALQITPNK